MEVTKKEHISNIDKNRAFYDKKYKGVNVEGLIKTLNNLDAFLNDATTTDISWVGMYVNNFKDAIKGKKIMELGLRWAVPMGKRPSKWLNRKAFEKWEESDPHPDRDNSSKHFKSLGTRFFSNVEIIPMGVLERFYRILPFSVKTLRKYRRSALRLEKYAPKLIQNVGEVVVIMFGHCRISILKLNVVKF